ncbi:uncharacterized protein LOC129947819 [Eupeodes corollae]|uniref:uncharacterized protein LOC129947819 n=1 Tax=Eupeodes corollae TaxID=290404 RepID=UPI0024906FA9|nr:uncharacterized protein LOC129947819 [Eupeodes corollae]
MKSHIVLALTLMALGSLAEKSKGRKSFLIPSNSKLRQIDIEHLLQNQNGYDQYDDFEDSFGGNIESEPMAAAPLAKGLKPDSSSGRLFFKKFFLMGKQNPTPQFIIITQNPGLPTTPPLTDTDPTSVSLNFTGTGTVITEPVDERDFSDDYSNGEDDFYEDDIEDENTSAIKKQYTNYKLVKGKAANNNNNNQNHQQGLRIVVPSKYLRNFQNKRNSIAMNPSTTYNGGSGGGAKVKKYLLSNNGNGNVKRKRTNRKPVRRFIVKQN